MKRRFALFATALLVALASTGAVFAYVSKVDARALADQQPTEVLVATQRIPAGTKAGDVVAGELAAVKTFARASVPEGALSDVTSVTDQVSLADVFPGEMLLAVKFGEQAAPNSGALTIPKDHVAVSVSLDDPRSVGGFVTPNSDVAVFDTFNVFPRDAGSGQTPSGDRLNDDYDTNRATRLLLPRVKVLAVGAQTSAKASPPDEDTAPMAGAAPETSISLTLAVLQKDAEKVIHAAETGSLWFALLSPESKTAPSQGVDSRRLFG